jgi:hypothetical protein
MLLKKSIYKSEEYFLIFIFFDFFFLREKTEALINTLGDIYLPMRAHIRS